MIDNYAVMKSLEEFRLPTYDEIPDVGLYLVQVTNYINGYLEGFEEMEITTSMISNYVKLKLVDKPTKKMYSREQIAYLIFIALAKTAITMDDIRKMFRIREELCTPREGYESFREEVTEALKCFYLEDYSRNTACKANSKAPEEQNMPASANPEDLANQNMPDSSISNISGQKKNLLNAPISRAPEEQRLLANVASVVAQKMYLNRCFSEMDSE